MRPHEGGHAMPHLIVWKDEEITKMKRDMDRLMSRFRDDLDIFFLPRPARRAPRFQLSETEDTVIMRAELPDVDPHVLSVKVSDDIVTIAGTVEERVNDTPEAYRHVIRRETSFTRSFQLPCHIRVDDVEATFKNGTLWLSLPKRRSEQFRNVEIAIEE